MGVARPKEKEREEKLLTAGLEIFIDAYQFLQSSRQPSMGESVLPIPGHAILAYCDSYGWDGEDRYLLIEVLSALDTAHLKTLNSKKGIGRQKSRGLSNTSRRL